MAQATYGGGTGFTACDSSASATTLTLTLGAAQANRTARILWLSAKAGTNADIAVYKNDGTTLIAGLGAASSISVGQANNFAPLGIICAVNDAPKVIVTQGSAGPLSVSAGWDYVQA